MPMAMPTMVVRETSGHLTNMPSQAETTAQQPGTLYNGSTAIALSENSCLLHPGGAEP